MNFQNHSCLLPQRTSDITNLEKRKGLWMGERVGEVRRGEGRGEDEGRGIMKIKFKATEKQTQQMRQQQTHE